MRHILTCLKCAYVRLRSGTRVSVRGAGHRLEIGGALLYGATIRVAGSNNRLTIAPGARLWDATIRLVGDNLHCVIGAHCRLRHTTFVLEDSGSQLFVSAETSGTGCTILSGEGGVVQIGRDCMMSVDADIRNTDGHAVIDAVTGQRLNPPRDTIVGDHVWIGLKAQVLKGVRIGSHSIVAAGAVVIRDVPTNSIVAGVPARPVRSGISWTRSRIPVTAPGAVITAEIA